MGRSHRGGDQRRKEYLVVVKLVSNHHGCCISCIRCGCDSKRRHVLGVIRTVKVVGARGEQLLLLAGWYRVDHLCLLLLLLMLDMVVMWRIEMLLLLLALLLLLLL